MFKKVLTVFWGACLLIAFSFPVMAETKVNFTGSYRVRAHYFNNSNLAHDDGQEEKASYFDQRFRAAFKIMPTENLTLNIATQALDNKWGTSSYSKRYWLDDTGSGSGLELYYAHMDIKTSVGLFSIGRQSAGVSGLTALGYSGSVMNPSEVFDKEEPQSRIKYILPVGNFVLFAVYEKLEEKDHNLAGEADGDYEQYHLMPQYKWSNGGANLLITYTKDSRPVDLANPSGSQHALLSGRAFLKSGGAAGAAYDVSAISITPSLKMDFGPFAFHTELRYVTGDVKYAMKAPGAEDDDVEGLGFYLDATYNYGSGLIGLQYAWFQGDDDAGDNTIKGFAKAGGDFNPFLIATNYGVGVGPDAVVGGYNYGNPYDLTNTQSNYWMLAAWLDHNLTEDVLLHAAVGYFGVNETGKKYGSLTEDANGHYGTEINLGMKYSIMSNLDWEIQLAYFMSGDYLKDKSSTNDAGNAYAMRNVLTLKF